jgi:uncharacterized protein Veg
MSKGGRRRVFKCIGLLDEIYPEFCKACFEKREE